MASSSPILHHPTLGVKIRGKQTKTTTQYRGLKYACIPGRWQDSIPLHTLEPGEDGIVDATRFGPSCPQKRGAQAWDLTLVGDLTLPTGDGQGKSEVMDEFECLHVNVTVPRISASGDGDVDEGSVADGSANHQHHNANHQNLLPVFVWIHGGALSMGANSWPQYDLNNFVARSAEIGKPVIGVSINYRLGVLGFLASRELGAAGNFGFKDQANALRWVRRFIGGFGGDGANVTAVGESAGGISLSYLLCAEAGSPEEEEGQSNQSTGLFDRVVIMSGEVTLRKPRGWEWHEEMYRDQFKYLGLEGLEEWDRVERLRDWDAEDMCQRLPLAQHFCGVVDGSWLRMDVGLGVLADGNTDLHKRSWCKEFVIGDTGDDGTVLKSRILDNPHALRRLQTLCKRHLTPSESSALSSAYNIPSTPSTMRSSTGQSHPDLLPLVSDLRFHFPTLTAHQGWKSASESKSKVPLKQPLSSRYHFHISNPFPGAFTGLASHELDVAYLLQNWNRFMDRKNRRLAKEMADVFIGYVWGQRWGARAGSYKRGRLGSHINIDIDGSLGQEKDEEREGQVLVFTNEGTKSVTERVYDRVWRKGRGRLLESIGAERLWALAEEWQGVRRESGTGRMEVRHGRVRARL